MEVEEILTLPKNSSDGEVLFVNTSEFLQFLIDRGEVLGTIPFYDFGMRESKMVELSGHIDIRFENTDNDWKSLFTHPLECMATGDRFGNGEYILALAPHREGDIRTNYNDYVVIKFNSGFQLLDIVDEYCSQMEFAVDVYKEDDYYIQYSCDLAGYVVYDSEYNFICNIDYVEGWDDLKAQIKKMVEKPE